MKKDHGLLCRLCACFSLLGLAGLPAAADEYALTLGAGGLGYDSDSSGVLGAEWHDDPKVFAFGADFSLAAGAYVTTDTDGFVGVGASAIRPLEGAWFVEGSVMPGIYVPDIELSGSADPSFGIRTMIGVGRKLRNGDRLSIGLSHFSSDGTDGNAFSGDAFSLRIRRRF